MKHQTKKIVAREFLLFLIVNILVLIVIIGIYGSNYVKRAELAKINKEIQENNISKRKYAAGLERKQFERESFYEKYIFVLGDLESPSVAWRRIEKLAAKDRIKSRWVTRNKDLVSFLKENGINSPDSFKEYVLDNSYKEAQAKIVAFGNRNKVLQTKGEKIKDAIFTKHELVKLGYTIFIVLFTAFFIIRYLFYCTIWSVKVLRNVDRTLL